MIAVTDKVVCFVVEREKFLKLIGGLEFEKYNDKDPSLNGLELAVACLLLYTNVTFRSVTDSWHSSTKFLPIIRQSYRNVIFLIYLRKIKV